MIVIVNLLDRKFGFRIFDFPILGCIPLIETVCRSFRAFEYGEEQTTPIQ